mmetsp:Transcript_9319/g.24036  ORF Transcript_9319/g.24036 Transcript_9319/m.24036 type:complete len:362 (+) Transcript_9319:100-1185(+)
MASGGYGTYGGRSFDGGPVPEFGGKSLADQQYAAGYQSGYQGAPGPLGSPSAYGAPGSVGPPPDRPPSEHSLLRSGGNHSRYPAGGSVNVWELIFVPWAFMAMTLVCYFLAGAHGHFAVLFVIPVVLLSLSAFFIRYHYTFGHYAEMVLGLLCLVAILISLSVGAYGIFANLLEYHRLSQGASYFNVLPEESAAGHLDATAIVFTNSTMVDGTRAFGFTDATAALPTTYCVAPVSDDGAASNRIQYWVAGINCCQARSSFVCSDAANANAHGGLALPQDEQRSEMFKAAVHGAQAAYQLTSGDDYLLLEWNADPIGYRNGLWHRTLMLFGIFGAVYLILSAMVGGALAPVLSPSPPADKAH